MEISNLSDTEYSVTGISLSDIFNRNYCVFDFEATGANQDEEHITQIGAVIVENNQILLEKTFNSLVRSPKEIPLLIEKLTGIKNSDIERAPSFSTVYEEFVAFTKNSILVTQAGYEFDWPLLKNECERNCLPMVTNTILDTKALFSYLHPEVNERVSTNYLIKYYNIDDSDIERHSALGDSVLISRIFIEILEEFKQRNTNEIIFSEPLRVKKVQLVPLS
ncbi:3'-5' exonuclease [Paenibacillus eucommiae]|uniref:DNA polymerase III epsilon subunit family exonuclease n=1 Tax=Paenibacillus eucommiae TaxID=1355755 RepID=A0ABS4J7H8_9BACL|nr:3'-5' exonuclease [Paenibacillus eucommiae]MBP1995778.1 DNA polymerase III epsilon subunit family exonuclease [Paenibacillus eucommiae]